jgi:hypothetical protein
MPLLRPPVLARLVCVFICAGCGTKSPQDSPKNSMPSEKFDRFTENIEPWKQCEHTEGYGCASIHSTGSLVEGSFDFNFIYSKCDKKNSETAIHITNSLSNRPTLDILVKLSNSESGSYICKGEADNSSCTVSIRIHETLATSTQQKNCVLNFRNTQPMGGEISCQTLSTHRGQISISPGSTFTCAP